MFKKNKYLTIIALVLIVLGIGSCGGGGGGGSSGSGSSGSASLMEGAVPPPDITPKTVTMQYVTEDGITVDIEAIEGGVIVQFDSAVSESTAETLITNNGGSIISKIPAIRYYLVSVTLGTEMGFINKMRQEPNVIFAMPDIPLKPQQVTQILPNEWDKYSPLSKESLSWYFKEIKAPEAWSLINGSILSEIEIGIIEQSYLGLAEGVKDFAGRLQNIPSYPTVDDHEEAIHGTAVTVFAAATGNNDFGNVGVNWWSKIRLISPPSKAIVLSKGVYLYGLAVAVGKGSRVINMSFGYGNGDGECQYYEKIMKPISDEALYGMVHSMNAIFPNLKFLLVKAAGNDSCEHPTGSTSLKPTNLIIVGASNKKHEKWYYSDYGKYHIDIAAPGELLGWIDYSSVSPLPTIASGTSFSAPLVAGAAALVWAKESNLTPQQVIQRLKSTANGSISDFGGAGILDVYKALGGTEQPSDITPPSVPTGLTATSASSSQINLSWNTSTDDMGVAGYKIYRGGAYLKSVTTTSTSNTGLEASTLYCYAVSAYDAAGNESGQSSQVCATTLLYAYSISGKVTLNGSGLSGVTITLSGSGSNSTTTDSNGNYTFTDAQNASYTITPSKSGYTFSPSSITVTVNNANVTGQDFSAITVTSGITWAKTYKTNSDFFSGISIKQTNDGGYIVTGGAITKLDANGNILWQKIYISESLYISATDVQQTSDGGYIVTGYANAYGGFVFLLKLYANGNVEWLKRLSGNHSQNIYHSLQQTSDGGYIVAGRTLKGDYYPWVLKFDASGNIQWERTYGNGGNNLGSFFIRQTSNGKYILAGGYVDDGLVLKLDTNGTVLWYKKYNPIVFSSIQQTPDGGYIATGTYDTNPSIWWDPSLCVLKLDNNGNIVWQKYLMGIKSASDSIQQITDGGYIVSGWVMTSSGFEDILVLKLDSSGNIQWQKTYGNSGSDYYSSIQSIENGYIVTGLKCSSQSSGCSDVWVLKTDNNGNIGSSCSVIETSSNSLVSLNENVAVTTLDSISSTLTTAVDFLTPTVTDSNATTTTQCSSQ